MNNPKIRTISVNDFNSIEPLIYWINENRVTKHDYKKYPAKAIFLSFVKCRFLRPYHIASLACLIHEYQVCGFKIKLIKIPIEIEKYFESFNFNQFCQKEEKNNFPSSMDIKTLPLWKIEPSAINVYPSLAQIYFEQNHFGGKDLFVLSNSLAELMNNVFDHSESKIPGYTFTQYNSSKNVIITCVCDFGIGIPKKVNNYLKQSGLEQIDTIKALQKAFELKFSTKTKPHNKGFGWDNIFTSINELKSKIVVISNDALILHLNNISKTTKLKYRFPGTLIIITLDTKNLPIKEDESSDELMLF
jgi:hypothetical protein